MSEIFASGGFSNADVDTLETVATIKCAGYETLYISFLVETANLSDFNVDFRVGPASDFFTVATAGADFTTPTYPVLDASGDLNTAAAGATVHWCRLDVQGVHDVRLQAAGTSSTITGSYGIC